MDKQVCGHLGISDKNQQHVLFKFNAYTLKIISAHILHLFKPPFWALRVSTAHWGPTLEALVLGLGVSAAQ